MAKSEYYSATINGGAKIAHGTKVKVATDIVPTLTQGRTVYVRQVANPTYVLELRHDGQLTHQAYSMGLPTDDASWVSDFITILSHTGAPTP